MKASASSQPLALTLAILAVRCSLSEARTLRHSPPTLAQASEALRAGNETLAEIKEKWDDMDEFLKVMFTMACHWKHGKDVRGAVAEKLAAGELQRDEVEGFTKQMQADNLQTLNRACGMIVAKSKAQCREGCGQRWGEALEKRSACDQKCLTVYTRFAGSCAGKVENLQKVYDMKLKEAAAKKQCHDGFCASFPAVWMRDDAAAMTAERDAQCASQCTADAIQLACTRKWQLQADFVRAEVATGCLKSSQAKACFDAKKADISSAQDTCSSGGLQTCADQLAQCEVAGKANESVPKAKQFCDERRRMCESQVRERCLADHTDALDAAGEECLQSDDATAKTCLSSALAQKEQEALSTCTAETNDSCPQDCAALCDVAKLSGCLGNLVSEHDAAQDFCEDVWHLLHETSEVDPVTGDPIVLMVQA